MLIKVDEHGENIKWEAGHQQKTALLKDFISYEAVLDETNRGMWWGLINKYFHIAP